MRPAFAIGVAAGACALAACGPSLTPDGLGETRVQAACHFAFACCDAIERAQFDPLDFKDEATCVDEGEKQNSALFGLDQEARDAIARKTGTYDADAAAKCTQPILDDVNQCKAGALFGGDGTLDQLKVGLLADPADPNCLALAVRDFVRGTVKDGAACETSLDCEDFGTCVIDATDPNKIAIQGKCKTPAKEGGACAVDADCAPGTFCDATEDPNTGTIAGVCHALLADGADCTSDSACKSGSCTFTVANGKCENSQTPCSNDNDCAANDFCVGTATTQTCGSAKAPDVQVCTGSAK